MEYIGNTWNTLGIHGIHWEYMEYMEYIGNTWNTLGIHLGVREIARVMSPSNLAAFSVLLFQSGKIAQELQYVKHDVRSKLDELKRAELERLRHYIRKQAELKQGLDPDHIKNIADQTGHIDGSNPHSFEIADLEKLIAKVSRLKDSIVKLSF